jgi:hypothetical protein
VKPFTTLGLDIKQQENIFMKMERTKLKWIEFIDQSFISKELRENFKETIFERFQRIEG